MSSVLVFYIDGKALLRRMQSSAGMHSHVRTQYYYRPVTMTTPTTGVSELLIL